MGKSLDRARLWGHAVLLAWVLAPSLASGGGLTNPFYAMDTAFRRPGLSQDQQFKLVKELGYEGIGWHSEPPARAKASAQAMEKLGLKMHTIYCGARVSPKGELSHSPDLPKLIAALKGHGTIIWLHIGGRGPAFDKLTGDEPLVAALRKLSDLAQANGLRIAIYPHYGEWTARFGNALKLAEVVNHPSFGVCFNLCHALAVGDEKLIPELLGRAGKRLFTVTICGADSGVKGPNWRRLIQTLDKGTYDVGIVLRKLKEVGFRGPIGFQGYGIRADARSILEPTIAAWRKLAGQTKP